MIYGFAYLAMVIAISAGWLLLAVLKKPEFIEKPIDELKNTWNKLTCCYICSN